MKFSFPWWKPPPSDFRHHLTCGPNRFSVFVFMFSQLLMVFHGFVWLSLVFQPSHFFITSLGDDENLVSLMKTASVQFWSRFACGPNRFSIFFACFSQLLMVFHGFVLFALVFQPSHFFITSLGSDEILVSLMKTASVRFSSPFDMWPESIFCVFWMFFAVAYGFPWFVWFS